MTTTRVLRSIKGRRLRVTRRSPTGQVLPGAEQLVTEGFVRVEISGVYQGGRQWYVEDVYGTPAIIDADNDVLKWLSVIIDLVDVDPQVAELLLDVDPLEESGVTVGSSFRQARNNSQVSIEVWTKNVTAECESGSWGYLQVPGLRALRMNGPLSIQRDVMRLSVSGLGMPSPTWIQSPVSASPVDNLTDPAGNRLAMLLVTDQAPPNPMPLQSSTVLYVNGLGEVYLSDDGDVFAAEYGAIT